MEKPPLFLVLLMLLCAPLGAQNQHHLAIPDIPGYKTLRCDFHIHTVFSDGRVWPAVRVDEAAREELDAIALTDHIEYRPWRNDIPASLNRVHDIAKSTAKTRNVILIRGVEISRDMPPGHLNAIFLEDCDALENEDWRKALAGAKRQNAFIIWNHPGWDKQQAHTTLWWPEHDEIHKNGWLHGIEVANGYEGYSPKAFQWALDKKLTLIGASDTHKPVGDEVDFSKGEHRASTLVFARERTAAAIREALDNRRTAVYFRDFLFGEEQWLRPLLEKSLEVQKIEHVQPTERAGARTAITLQNNSGLLFRLKKIVPGENPLHFSEYLVKPHGRITISVGAPADTGASEARFEVANFLTTPETPLLFTVKIPGASSVASDPSK